MSDMTIHEITGYRRVTDQHEAAKRTLVFVASCAIAWGAAIVMILALRDVFEVIGQALF